LMILGIAGSIPFDKRSSIVHGLTLSPFFSLISERKTKLVTNLDESGKETKKIT
jgi:hypothetical protein